jgi:hypothetical protein
MNFDIRLEVQTRNEELTVLNASSKIAWSCSSLVLRPAIVIIHLVFVLHLISCIGQSSPQRNQLLSSSNLNTVRLSHPV